MQVHVDKQVQHATDYKDPPVILVTRLKLGGGCETYIKPDGSIGTAGKGPLIQTDISATLGVSQDQYLFVPRRGNEK